MRVDFRAGRAVLDADEQVLRLDRGVKVALDRYRLTARQLIVRKTPIGVLVRGDGRLALCPCPEPPVSLGFTAALVAPPSDLVLENPTVRVGDVPVLWLPYLWVRARDRWGALPPRVEWRGRDGLAFGGGVHAPLGKDDAGELRALDLSAAVYTRGGVDVEAAHFTPASTTRVRWDHLDGSAIGVSAAGSTPAGLRAHAAWRADVLRGPRAELAARDLDAASRRWDRAEIGVVHAGPSAVLGVLYGTTAPRGAALRDVGYAGPALHGSWSLAAHSSEARVGLDVATRRTGTRSSALTFFAPRASWGVAARPGPFSVVARARAEGWGTSEVDAARLAGVAEGAVSLGLPLVRTWTFARHVIEPWIGGSAGRASGHEVLGQRAVLEGDYALARAGVSTALGRSRSAARLEVSGAELRAADRARQLVHARLDTDTRWLGARGEGGADLTANGAFAVAALRVGRVDRAAVTLGVAGLHGETRAVRSAPARDRPLGLASLDRDGWSGASDLSVAWTRSLATSVGADADLVAERWLALRGGLGYRHDCGCLALALRGVQRLGRNGTDVALSVELTR